MNKHCTILLNARAGTLRQSVGLEQVRQMVREIGLDAEVVTTQSPAEMRALVKRLVAEGVAKVAVAGGDGTVSLAVQELAYSDTALGILPQGTANNFATALRLPMDLPSALRVLHDGEVREVGLGRTGGRYFTEAAGVGFFADILALGGAGTKKSVVRSLLSLARVVAALKAHALRLTLDGKPVVERSVMCTVANSFRMSLAVPVAPQARLTDEELDVLVVGDLRKGELLTYFRAFRAQMHLSLPKITTLRAREIRIETRRRMNVHCDDRVIGTTPVTITSEPRALKVLVERL